MNKFNRVKIGSICESIFSGGTPDTQKKEYWGGLYPWLSSGETGESFIFSSKKTITEDGVNNSSTRLAKEGDTLIATAGQGKTRGQTSFLLIDSYINQSVMVLRPNKDLVEPLFLFYNLKSRYDELRVMSDASSSRGSITRTLIEGLDIFLPSLLEQKKIVDFLYSLDQKLIINNRQNKILARLRQGMLIKLLSGEIEVKV